MLNPAHFISMKLQAAAASPAASQAQNVTTHATSTAEPESRGLQLYALLGDTEFQDRLEGWMANLKGWFEGFGFSAQWADISAWFVFFLGLLFVCYLGLLIAKFIIRKIVNRSLQKVRARWAGLLIKQDVLVRLAHLVPIFILAIGLPLLVSDAIRAWILPVLDVYSLWVVLIVGYGLIEFGADLYQGRQGAEDIPIEGLVQACKLVLTAIIGLCVLSVIFAKSPLWFVSGLGAFMAIVLLIFRDSLLGLVAGLQLAANDMVRVGDWIEIPGTRVDGDVLEVNLTTVRVSNWDRTIAMVPAYDLFQNAFVNWRGMSDSGGRRIKRSINIDMSTIEFATSEMLEAWGKISLLRPYLEEKRKAIAEWNAEKGVAEPGDINGRRQTNIGAFRAYIDAYLQAHPKIHKEGFTFLIRQLQPTSEGLPIEVYVFTNDNRWVPYEGIQSDIFDHLLAMVPVFQLEVAQSPTGGDIRKAEHLLASSAGATRASDA